MITTEVGLEVRRVVGGIVHVYQVIKLRARQRRAATHDVDLLGNYQPWDHYGDDLGEAPTLKAEKRVTSGAIPPLPKLTIPLFALNIV